MRTVTVGEQQGDQTVISEGLQPEEMVVTDGVDKLQDGAKVTIGRNDGSATQPATAAATSSATRPVGDADGHTGVATTRTGEMTQGNNGGRRKRRGAQ
jgi:multidrug efflux system membrane fusion protein